MKCVVCYQTLAERVNGQYAHAKCQLRKGWEPSTSPSDFAVDEAIATGDISEETKAAMRGEIHDKFVAALGRPGKA